MNPSTGALSAVAGPVVASGTSPIQALVHPSGKFLYVLNAGSGDVSAFSISAPSGKLTPIACPLCAAFSPSGMAMHPTGQFLYVASFDLGAVMPYSIDTATGELTMGSPGRTRAGGKPGIPVVDPTGRYLYVADSGSSQVFGFEISSYGLAAVPGSPFAAGSGPYGIAASSTTVFVANQNSADVSVYQIGSGGTLMPAGVAVPAGGNPASIAVDPSGNYVYVANRVRVAAFNTTPSGAFPLTHVRDYSAGTTPSAVAVDPDGRFVYVTNFDSNDVSGFAISAGGSLIPIGANSTFGTAGPKSLTVHHIGDTTAISLNTRYPTPASPTEYGTPVEFRGTVTDTLNPRTIAQGSLTLTANGNAVPNGTAALDASGEGDFIFNGSTQYLPVGFNLIQITYNPSTGFEAPAPLQVGYTVTKATPGLAITYSPANPIATQPMTITVSAPQTGGRFMSGTVVFSVDNTVSGRAVPLTNGTASISYTPATGGHAITVNYSGDSYFVPATARPLNFHASHATTTTVSSSSTSVVYGEASTLTATVSAGGEAVSGTVDFYDGATQIGTANLRQNGGLYIAQLSSFKFTTIGRRSVTAVYSGDTSNLPSNSNAAPLAITISQGLVSVSTPTVSGTQTYGLPLVFTATVTAAPPGSGTPAGTVSFKEGAATLGIRTLTNGSASFTIPALAAGPHTITAAYGGDGNFLTGNSTNGVQVMIAPASPTVTATTTPASPVVFGQQVTHTATLNGTATTTGTVDFSINGTVAGSGRVSGNVATCSYTPPSAASYTVTAAYGGDANNNANSGSTTLVVKKASVSVSMPPVLGAQTVGRPVTLIATLSAAAPGSGIPTGTVTFQEGETILGTQALTAGSANVTTSSLTTGTHSITATYNGDANFTAGTSVAAQITIAKATPTVSMSANPGFPLVSGQAVTLTATLDGSTGSAFTGTVDFFDNATKINAAAVPAIGGQAQFGPYTISGVGTRAITAVYSGDANYNTANNTADPLRATVNQAPVGVSTPAVSGTATYGQPLTFTVEVSAAAPGSGTPTGTARFNDGPKTLGAATLVGGTATFTTSSLSAGTRLISAVYNGDANFLTGTSAVTTATIAKVTPMLSVTPVPASGLVSGQPAVLTAVLSGGTAATGTVDFFDNGIKVNSIPVAVSEATAPLAYKVSGAGAHTITAVYSGDSNYEGVNNNGAPLSLTVGQASTSVSTPAVSGKAVFGQPETFTVSVAAVGPGSGTPTGVVTFRDEAVALGTATLAGGSASLTIRMPAAGGHSITATYSGDANFAGATSPALAFTEGKADTATALSVFQTPTSTALTAVVHSVPGAGIPAGTVQFFNGTTLLGTAVLNTGAGLSATASLNLGVITGTITAVYSGDGNFSGSTSVGARIEPKTSLELNVGPNPATAGQTITFTVKLSWNGSTPPGGTIQFYDGPVLLRSVPASAQVTFTATLGVGKHNISAVYTGDATYGSSSEQYWLLVNKNSGVTLALAPDITAAIFGQAVTLTAKVGVQPDSTAAAPTGQVQYLEGDAVLGSAPLVNGVAARTFSNLAPGLHRITALYSGDGNWISTISNPVPLTVSKAATVTSIRAVTGAPGSGQMSVTGTVGVVLPGAGLPTGTVQFVDTETGQVLGAAALTGGTATASVPVSADAISISAVYAGDAGLLGSGSAPARQFSVRNSASYERTALSPDEIATLFSPGLTSGTLTAQQPLPNTLGGVTVTLIGSAAGSRQASLLYVSPTQLSFVVPAETAIGPATLKITTAGAGEITAAVMIGPVSPGLFAANSNGQGVAAAQIIRVHNDATQDVPQNTAMYNSAAQTWDAVPIDLSSPTDDLYLVLYATGIRHANSLATVTIDGRKLPVLYAGAQPTYAGLDQVNVLLPTSLKGAGTVNVTITVDGRPSNTVTLYLK